tara:strand:- start:674 stop:1615 length:942 start_codon:yes stop_codon:yes gene_type:complete
MAVRKPLYNNSGNLQEMTTAMVDEVIDQIIYQYSLAPSITLSVVGSGGNLGTINDTRLQAGAQSTSATSAPGEGTTAEPSVVTVGQDKINLGSTTTTAVTDSDGKTFPVYLDTSNNIQSMNNQDMLDTFIHPAIDLLTGAGTTSQQAGTYHVSSTTSVTGSTEVSGSNTPIFIDTRADVSAYSAGSIPETLDQPSTITNFYLQRIDGVDNTYTLPIKIRSDNDLQIYPEADFETMIQNMINDTAKNSSNGYKITYNLGGSGNSRGSGMIDTRLDGSGNYQTRFVNANDYRAQEFPNGSPQTITTTFLRITKTT